MNTTNKNEMDLLLRALGRDTPAHSANGPTPASSQQTGRHLDADELNCYAEGIASDAERARYIKHLADCDDCRRVVAVLVPAAGATRRHEAVEQKTAWSLREKLAQLFAPSVLRYAMPALALTAVLAIAIVVLRQKQQAEFVAQNQPHTVPAVSTGSQSEQLPTSATPQTQSSPAAQQQLREKNNSAEPKSAVVQPPSVVAGTNSSTDRAETDRLQPGTVTAKSQPTYAMEPADAAAPPPPPRPALADASKTAEARKEADTDMQKRGRNDNYSQAREENEVARQGPSKGGPSRNNSQNVGAISSVMSRSANNKDEKAAGSAAETRRVSGRSFHREGNVWVDADYAEGRATVKVSRGSEQYRALIADEPAIRSIAEQLGGEVIVIWKGVAYRIR